MAPEVIANNKYSEKADIFSFGVLLTETYTLSHPYYEDKFTNLTQAQIMYKIIHEGLRPSTDNLPLPLVQLVRDCWNVNPSLRPSFPEILIRLQRLESLTGATTTNTTINNSILGQSMMSIEDSQRTTRLSNPITYTTFNELMVDPTPSLDNSRPPNNVSHLDDDILEL